MVDGTRESYGLTARQLQILQLAAEDMSVKQIARELRISVRTIEGHFATMRSRTGYATIGGLTAWAVGSGIVTAPRGIRSGFADSGNSTQASGHGRPRGRPRLMTADKIAEAARLLGTLPLSTIARQVGVSRGTLYAHMAAIRAADR